MSDKKLPPAPTIETGTHVGVCAPTLGGFEYYVGVTTSQVFKSDDDYFVEIIQHDARFAHVKNVNIKHIQTSRPFEELRAQFNQWLTNDDRIILKLRGWSFKAL